MPRPCCGSQVSSRASRSGAHTIAGVWMRPAALPRSAGRAARPARRPSQNGCDDGRRDGAGGCPPSGARAGSWPLLPEEEDIGEAGRRRRRSSTCATSAPATWRVRALAPQLLDAADDPLEQSGRRAAVAEGHEAAVGGDRIAAARPRWCRRARSAALALLAEPESLELADDLEGERVVELADIDVGRAEAGTWRRPCAPARRPTQPLIRSGRRRRRGRSSAGAGRPARSSRCSPPSM